MSVIVVQQGHVPRLTGRTGTPGEQQFAIAAANRCRVRLAEIGHEARVIIADPPADNTAYKGDMFVAIHCDGNTDPSSHGMAVGFQNADGERLAHAWQDRYEAHGWNRGRKDDNHTDNLKSYYGVRHAIEMGNRRAFIVECGFLTNAEDKALLESPEGHDRVARALADVVANTFGKFPPKNIETEEDDMPLNDADKAFIRQTVLDIVRNEGISGAADASVGANKAILEKLEELEQRIGG